MPEAVKPPAPATPGKPGKPKGPSLFGLLGPYRRWVVLLVVLTMAANGLNLVLPKLIAHGIDAFGRGELHMGRLAWQFLAAAGGIFAFTYVQNVVQTIAAEKVARDLREKLSHAVSLQSLAYVQEVTPSKLLTMLTSDADGVKQFVSLAIASIVASLFLIVGASVLLLLTNWRLALVVLTIIPLIGGTFGFVLGKVRPLFKAGQEVLDRLNKVINESIRGAALVRVLDARAEETAKFAVANADAQALGMRILKMFSAMIPIVTFVSNLSTVAILLLGGRFVIQGTMTLGELAAFNAYIAILIFPIFILGFMSNIMARASASYARIAAVLQAPLPVPAGGIRETLRGEIELKNVSVRYGEKEALKDVSFSVPAGTRAAIVGPTAAGKTVLMSLLTGLRKPDAGTVLVDGRPLDDYDPVSFHAQVGFVFQESAVFNLTVRENIAFSEAVTEDDMRKAVETAELQDFIAGLPDGMETVVSERGGNLSGGQKQRLMLARALALNPRVLLLDDFTARVDTATEARILENVQRNYPGITVLSVTQKIAAAEKFDSVVLLMEGEVLAAGTHAHLLETSPEYAQIAQSQRSTNAYEAHPA